MKCTAKRTNGTPCNAYAVKGLKVCRVHGGSSKRAKAAAARRVEEEKAKRVAANELQRFRAGTDVDPAAKLLDMLYVAAGEERVWGEQVQRLRETAPHKLTAVQTRISVGKDRGGTTELRHVDATVAVEYRLWTEAQERVAKFAAAALRAGVEERRVKLAEDQGALVAQVIRGVLNDLKLSKEQAAVAPEVVTRHLKLLRAS